MDHLWTPWRSTYINAKKGPGECIFCRAFSNPQDDEANLVVHRGTECFVLLNRYPYTSGHLMIVPNEHVSRLRQSSHSSSLELIVLARDAEQILETLYRPDGENLGMNLGAAAGAGIQEHIHLHILPRWFGDANFMTAIGEARIIPESLEHTYAKVRAEFTKLKSGSYLSGASGDAS